MKSWIQKTGTSLVSAAAGIALTGAFGILAFSGSYNSFRNDTNVDVPETSAESYSAKTTTATEVYSFEQFKKATIDEYDMTVTGISDKNDAEQKKAEKPSEFSVGFPKENINAADVKNPPLGFTSTRSIAEEFYTVHDIISGKNVTLIGHEMICRMVNSEIGGSWGAEAIKAQAVAAYSYLRFNDSIGAVPTVGLKAGYSSKLENCVNAVEGQVVLYNGNIINAVYSASTAGYSTTSKDIWGTSYPYLQCVKSAYDNQDPNWGKEKKYTEKQVKNIIEKHTDISLSDNPQNWFKINSAHSGKYIGSVSLDGHSSCKLNGVYTDISGITLCNLFSIKSNAMDISYKDGIFTFKSYGWGHGVGMSQWGACLYARNGWTYDQILTHYYLNTTIGLSSVNTKAVERASKSEEELEKEAQTSAHTIDDSAVETNAVLKESSSADEKGKKNNTEDTSSQSEDDSKAETADVTTVTDEYNDNDSADSSTAETTSENSEDNSENSESDNTVTDKQSDNLED